jgi:hypothetical protein
MVKPVRQGTLAFLALSLPLLPGCTTRPTPAPIPVAPRPAAFSVDTPVDKIAADPRGEAVLKQDLPDLMSSSYYNLFNDMSLTQIATLSGGRLTKVQLDHVQADLAQLSSLPP